MFGGWLEALVSPMNGDDFASITGATNQVVDMITQYREMVLLWNDRMNLVGPSFKNDFWQRHALDSSQLFHVEHQALRWADVGTGAGFPGVILAILLKERPGAVVVLVESIAKRVQFIREVGAALSLPVVIHHGRAETMCPTPSVDVVTARACAPLTTLLTYTAEFFKKGARGSFLKGRNAEKEISEAQLSWSFNAELVPSLSDPSGKIVQLRNLERRA